MKAGDPSDKLGMATMGRPTLYTEKLAEEICERLAEGESLREMCRDDPLLPSRSTVNLWCIRNAEFSARVAQARAMGSHALIEEAREIADTPKEAVKTVTKETDELTETTTTVTDTVERDRLRVEQRWREAQSHNPRAYSQKQQVEHSGTIGVVLGELSDDELNARLLELVTTGRLKLPAGGELVEVDEPPIGQDEEDDCPW